MSRRSTASLLALAAVGCGGGEDAGLTVFAAASAADVCAELVTTFDRADVRTSFGPSSGLARQIEDGAPAGLYLSASRRWADYLHAAGALAGEPTVVCRNRLVCAAPAASDLAAEPPQSAHALAERLAADDVVAIADEAVPAGEYARQSLAAAGALDALGDRLVGQADVRAVLRAVAAGDVAAGFVYATDARRDSVAVLFELDAATHAPVEYLAAVTAHAPDPELARAFLDHLRSPEARAVLARAGFEVDGS